MVRRPVRLCKTSRHLITITFFDPCYTGKFLGVLEFVPLRCLNYKHEQKYRRVHTRHDQFLALLIAHCMNPLSACTCVYEG